MVSRTIRAERERSAAQWMVENGDHCHLQNKCIQPTRNRRVLSIAIQRTAVEVILRSQE